MNALDQAFIKAFAKDRSNPLRRHAPTTESSAVDIQPVVSGPCAGFDLSDFCDVGEQLRVDLPDPNAVIPSAHTLFPLVQQLESYDPDDVGTLLTPLVIVEDRLKPLDDEFTSGESDTAMESYVEFSPPTDSLGTDQQGEAPTPQETQKPSPDALVGESLSDGSPAVVGEETESDLPVALDLESEPGYSSYEVEVQLATPEPVTADLATKVIDWPGCDEDPEVVSAVCSVAVEGVDTSWDFPDPLAPEPVAPEPDGGPVVLDQPTNEASERELAAEDAPIEEFVPAWEVDAFNWPDICSRLDDATANKLRQSGEELYEATQDGLKVLAVTSTSRGEGRTTLALSLARNAALAGSRVALVDADLPNPQLASRLGLESPCDWNAVLRQQQPLSEAAVASLQDGISLFPLKSSTDAPAGQVDAFAMQTVLRDLGRHFDLIVVDLPPATADEAPETDRSCPIDMAVVVRNVQTSTREQVLTAVKRLRETGVRAVGIAENFTRSAKVA